MLIVKYFMLFLLLFFCTVAGKLIAMKYINRLNELQEIQNALNIFETKIKFTYEPIAQIFTEISQTMTENTSQIFINTVENMKENNANKAWEKSIEESKSNLKKEDKQILMNLSKLLGQTDVEGQVSQIQITRKFLETQIEQAKEEKQKNEKLYSKLGVTIGLVIVIILI